MNELSTFMDNYQYSHPKTAPGMEFLDEITFQQRVSQVYTFWIIHTIVYSLYVRALGRSDRFGYGHAAIAKQAECEHRSSIVLDVEPQGVPTVVLKRKQSGTEFRYEVSKSSGFGYCWPYVDVCQN